MYCVHTNCNKQKGLQRCRCSTMALATDLQWFGTSPHQEIGMWVWVSVWVLESVLESAHTCIHVASQNIPSHRRRSAVYIGLPGQDTACKFVYF